MISDERLREAAQQAEKALLASLPEPKDCKATFSPAFERKMKKLVKRTDHPIVYWIQKSVACLMLILLFGGGSALALSTEARAAFVGWVREIYETWFVYHYEGDDNITPKEIQYRPMWLPEGYSQALVPELTDQVNVLYAIDDGPTILFGYSSNPAASALYIQGNDAEFLEVTVNGIAADFYLDKEESGVNCLVWENPQNNIVFWISANLSEDVMIKIAESVDVQK